NASYAGVKFEKHIAKAKKLAASKAAYIAIIPAVLLILPIWPSYTPIQSSGLPYVEVNISNAGISGKGIYFSFNASVFSAYENQNMSNLAFYSYGKPLQAEIQNGSTPYSDNVYVYLANFSRKPKLIQLFFLPFNYGPINVPGRVKEVNFTGFPKPRPLYVGAVKYSGKYENISNAYNVQKEFNSSSKALLVVSPPYFVAPVCPIGSSYSLTLSATANRSIDFFIFNSYQNFSKATIAAYNNTGYKAYKKTFEKYAYITYKNITNAYLQTELTSCIYYAIVPLGKTSVSINKNQSYYSNVVIVKKVKVPAILNMNTTAVIIKPGFIPFNLLYMLNKISVAN
ncbi:MAG: hypothetical protein QXN59_00345, partial [Candidatus Micrarchaeaceae archaeon]